MTLYWGAWATGSTNRGMRVGIDVTFSAVTNTSTSCTATMKFYTQNVNTWDEQDKQQLEFDGNYSLPETHDYYNQGDEAGAEYRTTRTYTWTYSASSYNVVPTVLDIRCDVLNMYNGAKPYIDLHINFPVRPFGAPTAPDTCAVARTSDVSTKVTWQNNPTTGKPYTALWLERYIYLGPGMVAATGVGSWTRIGTLGATVVTYQDTGAVANRKYTYRVQADNSVATSGYAQSGIIYTTPATSTSPTRTEGTAGAQTLTWVNNVGYSEYQTEVWRAVAGTYSLLTTLAAGVTTYTDTTASAAQKTKYKFRTKTTSGTVLYSAYSAETTETSGTPTAPAAPTGLKPASGTIDPTAATTFTWTHVPTDGSLQTYYEVQYRHVGDASWQTSGKIASATSSWIMPANAVAKGNVVEWQVRTWGYSSTLAGAWSALAKWTTTPLIPLKYPMFLDVDSGQVEANSQLKLITEQTRRVATVARTVNTANSTVAYGICSYTLPVSLARTGKRFRIKGIANFVPDTAGMYDDLRIFIGVGATTTGYQLGAGYVDHRISGRETNAMVECEYTFDPATAGGENIATINIVLVGFPGGGGSYVRQVVGRAAFLIIDEIIEGQSLATASGGPAAAAGLTLVAGNGLVGGGDLTANRSFDVVPADNTLKVNADSVQVNTAVMATRAYADSIANAGGGGSGSGENEVVIDILEPVPVASHPELWIDLDDDTGGLKPAVSGTWGTAPLDIYGSNTLLGRETYIDAQGQMRARPEEITGRLVTDLSAAYPAGSSIQYIAAADAANWPGGRLLVTHKTSNGLIAQWLYNWSAVTTKAWYRNGTTTGWSPWVVVADSAADTGWITVEDGIGFNDADWINYPSGYAKAAYRRIGTKVELRGLCRTVILRSGATGIFTLPVGFRPLAAEILNANTNLSMISSAASAGTAHTHTAVYNISCRVDVTAGGVVQAVPNTLGQLPVNAYFSISGLYFYTD